MSQGWTVVLDGVVIAGCTDLPDPITAPVSGWMNSPPEGLGVPPRRVEDQTYPQRDGVTHYLDWYEPRIVTLPGVSITQDRGCSGLSARQKASVLMATWARHCDDTELVLWPEVDDTVGTPEIVGPYGIRGKPRVAELRWLGQGSKAAQAVFRFDSTDQRLYLLDADGTPGSGSECFDLTMHTRLDSSTMVQPNLRYWLNTPSGSTSEIAWINDPSPIPTIPWESVDWSGDPKIISGMSPVAPNQGTSTYFNAADLQYFGSYDWNDYDTFTFWWKALDAGTTDILTWDGTNTIILSTDEINVDGVPSAFSGGTQATLEDGNPHYLAFVASGANTLFYIDGVLAQTLVGISLHHSPFSVSPNYGYFSELSLYSDALTSGQLAAQYQLGGFVVTDTVVVSGNLCVPVIITLTGLLTKPIVQLADGSFVGLNFTLPEGGTATIDTETGQATFSLGTTTSDVTPQVTGDPFLTIGPGNVEVYASSEGDADTGTIEMCWRPAVVSA